MLENYIYGAQVRFMLRYKSVGYRWADSKRINARELYIWSSGKVHRQKRYM